MGMNLNDFRKKIPQLEGLDDEAALNLLHEVYYPDADKARMATALGVKITKPEPVRPQNTLMGFIGDRGLDLVKGAVAVPEAAVGVADLVTGGAAGRAAEEVGFRPREAKEILSGMQSDAYHDRQAQFQAADGIVAKTGVALTNPSLIAGAVTESLPLMAAGGAVGRGVMAVAPKMASTVGAGALGEGAVAAGSTAEQIRQQTADGYLTPKQTLLSAAAGVGTAVFGYAGGKVAGGAPKLGKAVSDMGFPRVGERIAKGLGVNDVDTLLVRGSMQATRDSQIGVIKRVAGGMFSESMLEELPQSVVEQMAQNIALDKPLMQDVDSAIVMGALSGAAMGGGAALLSRPKTPTEEAADTIRTNKVPEAGTLSKAVNTGIEASAKAVEATAPIAPAPSLTGFDPSTMIPENPLLAGARVRENDSRQEAMTDQAMAKLERMNANDMAVINSARFDQSRGANEISPTEVVEPAQAGDILNPAGEPFKTRMAADRAAKKTPGAVVPVEGGFIVRPQESVNVQDVLQAPEVSQAAPAISQPGQAPQAVGAQPAGPAAVSTARPGATGGRGVQAAGVGDKEIDAKTDAVMAAVDRLGNPGGITWELTRRLIAEKGLGVADNTIASLESAAKKKAKDQKLIEDLYAKRDTNPGAQSAPAAGAQAQAQGSEVEALRQQLRDVEDRIIAAAPSAMGQGGGDIEAAMKSRKVPVTLKAQRKKLKEQLQQSQDSQRNQQQAKAQPAHAATETVASNSTSRDDKARWLKSVADMNRMSGQFGAQIDGVANGRLSVVGNPNATKQGRALMAAVDEARRAGATNEEIAQAAAGRATAAPVAAELTLDDKLKQANDQQAATEQQSEPGRQSTETAYTLPSGSIGDEWRDGQKRSPEHPDFTPTPRQQRLMNEVKKVLEGGAIYNDDVTDKVAKALGVSDEVLASNRTGVQGGDFGYDVYLARKAVEAQAQEADAAKIRAELNLQAGDKLGTIIFNDFKQTNSVEVVSIAEDGRRASFKGKRGAATVTFESLIPAVKFAIERAHEKGKRKDSYEEFIAGRSASLQEGIAAAQDKAQQAQAATENAAQPITRADVEAAKQQAAKDNGKLEAPTKSDEPIMVDGLRVSPSVVKVGDTVKPMWKAQSAENAEREKRGERQLGGDRIVETREQAIKTADQEAKRYAKEKADRAEMDAREKAERDAAEARREANKGKTLTEIKADGYMAQEIKDGKTGDVLTRAEWVKRLVDGGAKLSVEMVNKIKPMSRAAFNRATNQEQAAHEKKVKAAGQVPEYSIGDFIVTKTEYDFAQKLVSSALTAPTPAPDATKINGPATAQRAIDAFNADDAATAQAVMAKLPIAELQVVGDAIGFRPQINENAKRYRERVAEVADRLTKTAREQGARERALFDKLMNRAMEYDRAADHAERARNNGVTEDGTAYISFYRPMDGGESQEMRIPAMLERLAADVRSLRNDPDYAKVSGMVREARPRVFEAADAPPAAESDAPAKDDKAATKLFYVTMIRGSRVARLAGPFDTKEQAEAMVGAARKAAEEADPRSVFDAFGVSGVTEDVPRAGTLNAQLGLPTTVGKLAEPERFAAGKALTKEQRKQVLATLTDVYKTKRAERELKGVGRDGNERYGYVHSPELFEKSDITGAMVRYYVTLPDGKIAHPTELFPDYTQSDIDSELERRATQAKNMRDTVRRQYAPEAQQFNSVVEAGRFWDEKSDESLRKHGQWRTILPSLERTTLSNGEKFIMVPDATMNDQAMVEAFADEGWTPWKASAAEPTKPAAEMSAAELPRAAPAKAIEDFGEKLEGARKDYATKLKDAEAVDIATEPLSKSWPEPDYDKLLAGGADPYVVAFVHAARDEVPTKPVKAWKLKGWVQSVEMLRGMSTKLLDGTTSRRSFDTVLARPEFNALRRSVGSRAELYELVGHAKSLKGVTYSDHFYNLYKGQENVRKWVVEQKAKATAFSNWPRELAVGDTKAEMLEKFKAKLASESLGGDKASAKGQFIIYRKRNQDGAFIGKKIGREYIDLKKLPDVAAARAYLESNTADLSAALERYKDTPFERNAENRPRVGGNHRNGAAVTPEVFAETFGFRGVQFGNYVEQDRRQSDLNQTFDALMDMAAVLGLPPRALSLNGRLGLAFGARGKGGKNAPAAHYEPDTVVINLTKGNGPGSLGHEWWHAVDNYFGKEFGAGGFATDGVKVDRLRAEMQAAFKAVRTATQAPTLRRRAAELDKRRTKPYWNTPLELSARSFESYLIAKLNDQSAANDYLANVVDEKVWNISEEARATFFGGEAVETYPYPGQAELPAVRAAFDEFFQTVDTRETDNGVAMFSRGNGPTGTLSKTQIQRAVDKLTLNWLKKPDIHILDSMDDAPDPVRRVWQSQDSKGARGKIEGFHYKGGVYIVADAMESGSDIIRVLFHESLGHFGLRNVFGTALDGILKQIAVARPADMRRKATQYGFDLKNDRDRMAAAEELLAEMAQTRPEIGFVQRAIAAIKTWLRENVPYFRGMELSDDEIVRNFLEPARGFVERGIRGEESIRAALAFSKAFQPVWYSALQNSIEAVNAKAAPAAGWAQTIDGIVKAGKAKADEVEWSGVKEWLQLQTGKVTREQVMEYLDANGVQVQEVTLGGDGYAGDFTIGPVSEENYDEYAIFDEEGRIVGDERFSNDHDAVAALDRMKRDMPRQSKYSQYVLPGGENYREVLLTLPSAKDELAVVRHPDGEGYALQRPDGTYVVSGPESVVPGTVKRWDSKHFAQEYGKDAHDKVRATQFKSGHWDQPNVLAHIRLNDRVDSEGRRVLFVEEVQSDWGQEGKKKGFLNEAMPEKPASYADIIVGDQITGWGKVQAIRGEGNSREFDVGGLWIGASKFGLDKVAPRSNTGLLAGPKGNAVPLAPFVTSTDKWLSLALKRVITMAAQEGYDRVAFVNGEQSAARYDLSKQVDYIDYRKRGDDSYDVAVIAADGRTEVFAENGIGLSRIEDVVGKEVAQKIADGVGQKGRGSDVVTLRGLDLKVGGEGMRAFYDKILPNTLKDVLKKVGGGRVEMVNVGTGVNTDDTEIRWTEDSDGIQTVEWDGGERKFDTEDEARAFRDNLIAARSEQPGFTITPAMREKVAGGLPLFSRQVQGKDQTDTPAFKKWFGDSKVVDANGKPLVVYHGTTGDVEAFDLGFSGADGVKYGSPAIFATSDQRLANDYAVNKFDRVISDAMRALEKFKNENPGTYDERYEVAREAVSQAFSEVRGAGRTETGGGANVMPLFMALRKPLVVDAGGQRFMQVMPEAIARAMADGRDGLIVNGVRDHASPASDYPAQVMVAFRPEQIKSAIGNRGTFDPNDADIRFSRAADLRKEAAGQVVELFHTATNVPGRMNWWHKTVGTMYNLAKRSPEFGRVFSAVQDFIDDTAYYADRAARLAPNILPKLETWRDVFKSPMSAIDNRAIRAPIFEGTLTWMRDESGKPVKAEDVRLAAEDLTTDQKAQRLLRNDFVTDSTLRMWRGLPLEQYESIIEGSYERHMLRAGIVFTPDELKSLFKLTDGQVKLYQEFRRATDMSLTNLAISEMVKLGGQDTASMRQAALESEDVVKASAMLRDHLLELADSDAEKSKGYIDAANKIIALSDKAKNLMDKGYAPLSRFGHYTVDVVGPDGTREYFGMFESRFEAAKMAEAMAKNYPDARIERGTVSEQAYKLFAGVTPETIELFGEILGLDTQGDGTQNQAFKAFVQRATANRSAMKRLLERKGIAGFSEDAGRVLAGFVFSNGRRTAGNLHGMEMKEAAEAIPKQQGELKDHAVALVEYVQNPQEEAQGLRGLLFTQYIGGSIASAIVNMTQPLTMSLPYLSQFGGITQAAKQMARAAKDVGKTSTGDKALDAAMTAAEEKGIVSPQEVHQLQQQAAGRAALQVGDGTMAGDARAKAGNALSKTMLAWGKLFSAAEQFNRRVTFIAAYRTAVDRGIENPAKFAEDAVIETQGLYNKGNKPKWARGAIGSTLFTFKQYSVAYVEMLGRLAKSGPEGRRAALYALAILFMLSGAGGLPGADDLDDLISGLMQKLGYNFNSKSARRAFFAKHLGQAGADFVERGVSGLAGVPIDISGRMGLGNLIPGTGLLTKKTDHTSDVAELAGPAGDLAKRAFQAGSKAMDGDLIGKDGAVTTLAPLAVRNLSQAADMAKHGMYRDARGRKVVETDQLDALSKAFGFQPNDVKRVQDATREVQQMISLNKIRESEIADQWAKAMFERDKDGVQEARDALKRWNADNPESPIRISMQQINKRLANMRMSKEDRMAKTASKEIRATVRRELEAAR